ncbi:programmed cell death 1 ligand 2 isoform X2 [Zootoca vivipara]|uniref:programmed cell death 1 ligand 2 isoform X2 n=1 Tax=Zootoca vivipara TaxID=8524 RepID=UPI001591BC0B|nr:programmed cell death 1 ligand 2-like isoform X2 [Zootoca vivipara]XP_060124802.1 programmed cell death 1 ligand 2 isoform X2 [Zootoca vivipara]
MIPCSSLTVSRHRHQGDMSRQMSKLLPIVLLEIHLHMIAALFTVKVLQPRYTAEYGSDVIMGCHFPVHSPLNLMGLSVSWQRKLSLGDKEVYKLNNGQEDLTHQDSDYHGRASLSREELDKGLSLLSIANVKPTDAGVYICVVKYEGADYKYITLEVEAPYKRINLQERREEEDLILTCHSEGYPLAEVSWHYDERNLNASIHANTTHEMTSDGLFNITSTLRVRPSTPGNYSCAFWNQELNQETSAHKSVVLPDKISPEHNGGKSPISFILPICLLALFLLIAIAIKVQRSKSSTKLRTQKGKRRKF